MFKCLPFGLSSVPRVFTKLLKPVVGFLRQIGCQGATTPDHSVYLPIVRGLGTNDQPEEIHVKPHTGVGISGISGVLHIVR